ncbi:MAG: hypothetical protein ABR540_18285 [Acidimicrobiales bacterium]|nr:hypothetical protein [Actinomycetota bacterium]
MAELDASATKLAGLEPTAPVAQVRQLRAEMEARYRDVQEAAEDADAVRIDTVTQAYNNVLRSTNGVNSQEALAQAEPEIDRTAGEFSDARVQLHTSSGC